MDSSKDLPPTSVDSLDQEIVVTLLADQDSNEGFEEFDFSRLRIDPDPVNNSSAADSKSFSASSVLSVNTNQRPIESPFAGVGKESGVSTAAAQPFSTRKSPRESWKKVNWKMLGVVGMILIISLVPYGLYRFWTGRSASAIKIKTPLDLSPIGVKYADALFQLKKVERVMTYMENGFLEKKLPQSELAAVHDTRTRFEAIVKDDEAMREANQLFDDGQKAEAEKILSDRIEQMVTVKKEIEKQTARLTARVHN